MWFIDRSAWLEALLWSPLCLVFRAYYALCSRPEWTIYTKTPYTASQTGYPVRLCACAVQARSLETGLRRPRDVRLLNSRLSQHDGTLFRQWLYFSCVISPAARFIAMTLVMTSIVEQTSMDRALRRLDNPCFPASLYAIASVLSFENPLKQNPLLFLDEGDRYVSTRPSIYSSLRQISATL